MTPSRMQSPAVWVTLVVLVSGAAYLGFLVVRPFIEPLLYGVIAATLAYPMYSRMATRLKHPSLAAFLTTVIVAVAFAGPIAIVISIVVRELRSGYAALGPQTLQALEGPLNRISAWLGTDSAALRQAIVERVGAGSSAIMRQIVTMAGATGGGLINALVTIMALYFGLRSGGPIQEQVLAHSPLGRERTARMSEAARTMLVASFYGVIAVATAQGILCGLGAWIAGLPSPALWGLATMICSVIPLVGSGLVWLPAAIVLFSQGSIGYGIFMLIWGTLVISQIDTLVRPWVLTTQVPMNGLAIFITLLGGAQAFGLIGIFIGPVILAVTLELLQILREEVGHSEGTG